MKLNLGCGYNKLDGFTNVDSQESCEPDILVDLEELPWPFESNSADEVVLCHVLEHLGETSDVYLKIIQELYRVSQHSAQISITVPHPRHDDFMIDPTHVRPILPDQFYMFSKTQNKKWKKEGCANTALADYLNVDFEVTDTQWILDTDWKRQLKAGEISSDELVRLATHQYNIVKEIQVTLRVIKI